MSQTEHSHAAPGTKGRVLHSAAAYDLLVWLFMLGRAGAFRERLLATAQVAVGEAALDVGCGTGSLAIAAKRRVGPAGKVSGIDASPEMIARARKKARSIGVDVAFSQGIVEALPYPDASFDVVLSTLMLHHLPRETRRPCIREIRRVLRPTGRTFLVDFGRARDAKPGLIAHLHRRHGGVPLDDIIDLVTTAGLTVSASGPVGIRDLSFVLASRRP